MEVTLRGVRGSIANPAPDVAFYGGNTTCIELRTNSGELAFFDAGTGIRGAGNSLPDAGECHVFISHGHIDHILGLWFFKPVHLPQWITHLYLPDWLEKLPEYLYQCELFPAPFNKLGGDVRIHLVKAGDTIQFEKTDSNTYVECLASNHPGKGLAYRVHADRTLFVYSGDHELDSSTNSFDCAKNFLEGADIAVVDATYNKNDYHSGWGHSAWEDWVKVAQKTGVRNLILSHHEPGRTDRELDHLSRQIQNMQLKHDMKVYIAREGTCFTSSGPVLVSQQNSDWLPCFLEELSRYKDEYTILDLILAKAREIAHADAGTIFLAEGDELVFAYTHNDSLFSADNAHMHAYSTLRVPIDKNSIAGYAATTGQPVNIADVRKLPIDAPYKFNESFDGTTGYKTCSLLTIPFFGSDGGVLGVIQLVNSINQHNQQPTSFTLSMLQNVRQLVRETASILERSAVERKGVYGILRMAAVHDPAETGPHAERVGAIAAELYHCWAKREGHTIDAIRYDKGRIRLAAMLHDIGKVGISDLILKKPSKLTAEEFSVMRGHTRKGASILTDESVDFAKLAHDIALHHHQKWNGSGYADSTDDGRLAGEDIPLAARITAIADVFDALVSPRCYKKAWTFAEALEQIGKEAGEHFDPYLVELLADMGDLLPLIYEKYPEVEELETADSDKPGL